MQAFVYVGEGPGTSGAESGVKFLLAVMYTCFVSSSCRPRTRGPVPLGGGVLPHLHVPRTTLTICRFLSSATHCSELPCQRDQFDIPHNVCYLNAAYMGPSLTSTASIWVSGAAAKSTPWALSKEDFYADRQQVRTVGSYYQQTTTSIDRTNPFVSSSSSSSSSS